MSPLWTWRELMATPVMGPDGAPSATPCAAAISSSHCHSGSAMHAGLRHRRAHRVVIGERKDPGLTICPVSWRLPATNSTSPFASRRTPARMASARSPISRAPGAAAKICARIAAGESLLGLSSVTITMLAFSLAMRPMIGRLPVSRSPPQPSTQMSLPGANGRSASSAAARASGLWA